MRHLLILSVAMTLPFLGCGGGKSTKKETTKSSGTKKTNVSTSKSKPKPKVRRKRFRFKSSSRFQKFQKQYDKARKKLPDGGIDSEPDSPGKSAAGRAMSEELAVERLGSAILDSVELRSTLVIWLVDASKSAENLRERTLAAARSFYSKTAAENSKKKLKNELLSAVGYYSDEVNWLTDAPIGEFKSVGESFDKVVPKTSGKENTFAAVTSAIDKFKSFSKRRFETMVVVISDEAGDDAGNVDQVVQLAKKHSVLVYTIGVPAVFGRKAALVQSVEAPFRAPAKRRQRKRRRRRRMPRGPQNVVQGPESRHREFIQMPLWGNRAGVLIDAGFGPFALERLCRESGGRYIVVRRESFENAFPAAVTDSWPAANALVPDSNKMRLYAPNYVSEGRYQKMLAENKARLALHKAAKMPITNLPEPLTSFAKARNEAEFNRRLTQAQQLPAIVQPQIERLYSALRLGESDRAKLKSPRWQAAFDLAIGRVLAMKVRIDGYNSLLAAMKRGKQFEKPGSTTWILEGSDKIAGSSILSKTAGRARKYLQGVIDNHPNTPWAEMARLELETPIGWKWTEQ